MYASQESFIKLASWNKCSHKNFYFVWYSYLDHPVYFLYTLYNDLETITDIFFGLYPFRIYIYIYFYRSAMHGF